MATHYGENRNECRRAIKQGKGGSTHAWHQMSLVERIALFVDLHDQPVDGSKIACK